jgi:hypothetical protein
MRIMEKKKENTAELKKLESPSATMILVILASLSTAKILRVQSSATMMDSQMLELLIVLINASEMRKTTSGTLKIWKTTSGTMNKWKTTSGTMKFMKTTTGTLKNITLMRHLTSAKVAYLQQTRQPRASSFAALVDGHMLDMFQEVKLGIQPLIHWLDQMLMEILQT